MKAMIEQAKAERTTIERLAIDARQQLFKDAATREQSINDAFAKAGKETPWPMTNWQLLVDVYCRSLIRLNAIIRIAEMQSDVQYNRQIAIQCSYCKKGYIGPANDAKDWIMHKFSETLTETYCPQHGNEFRT